MAADLSPDDLKLLIRAAQKAGLNVSKLRAGNPWNFQGEVALTLQAAVTELDPAVSERLQAEAGVKLSLGAAAAIEGLQDWTPELEAEVAAKVPATYKRLESEAEEAAYQQAFGGWNQQRAEAEELARKHRYNVAYLTHHGHHLAAKAAAEHHDQQRREEARRREQERAWIRSLNAG
jgi:hypothetical protein